MTGPEAESLRFDALEERERTSSAHKPKKPPDPRPRAPRSGESVKTKALRSEARQFEATLLGSLKSVEDLATEAFALDERSTAAGREHQVLGIVGVFGAKRDQEVIAPQR